MNRSYSTSFDCLELSITEVVNFILVTKLHTSYENVTGGNIKMKLKLDNGADCNILPRSIYGHIHG